MWAPKKSPTPIDTINRMTSSKIIPYCFDNLLATNAHANIPITAMIAYVPSCFPNTSVIGYIKNLLKKVLITKLRRLMSDDASYVTNNKELLWKVVKSVLKFAPIS